LKLKLLLLTFLFAFLNCFSQTVKQIHGKIVFNGMAIEKIDIVNLATKKNSTTNSEGNFTIEAKVGDELFILSNDYYDIKMLLKNEDFSNEILIINLSKKPIELDEVTINKVEKIKVIVSPEEIKMARLAKYENGPKIAGFYTAEMPYETDFVGLFKKIFKSNKKKEKDKSRFIDFKSYIHSKFDITSYFYKKLDLKPEEIDLFFTFIENDPKHKTIMKNENSLETIEFLNTKHEVFKKLER
jgi:hypothetical protein